MVRFQPSILVVEKITLSEFEGEGTNETFSKQGKPAKNKDPMSSSRSGK
jgi:hypothetical protein